jgi:hypothetical protein
MRIGLDIKWLLCSRVELIKELRGLKREELVVKKKLQVLRA